MEKKRIREEEEEAADQKKKKKIRRRGDRWVDPCLEEQIDDEEDSIDPSLTQSHAKSPRAWESGRSNPAHYPRGRVT
ncbi:hypothetical protein QYF36_003819 [Acer negundo]|nr:hypothetical protein QYF36_003819 [Acer negundo]